MGNKQAVLVRIPGHKEYTTQQMEAMAISIQNALRETIDKEIVVLIYRDDIHFMNQEDITNLIDKLQNVLEEK